MAARWWSGSPRSWRERLREQSKKKRRRAQIHRAIHSAGDQPYAGTQFRESRAARHELSIENRGAKWRRRVVGSVLWQRTVSERASEIRARVLRDIATQRARRIVLINQLHSSLTSAPSRSRPARVLARLPVAGLRLELRFFFSNARVPPSIAYVDLTGAPAAGSYGGGDWSSRASRLNRASLRDRARRGPSASSRTRRGTLGPACSRRMHPDGRPVVLSVVADPRTADMAARR